MCGRYYFSVTSLPMDSPLGTHGLDPSLFSFAHGEIFPSEKVIVLVGDADSYKVEVKTWGLTTLKKRIINARLESLGTKPFYDAMLTKRALIPCNGYYEWKKDKQGIHKCFISKKTQPIFYLAALYNEQDEFVILTRTANHGLAKIHHRMPIVLDEAQILSYLHNDEKIITNPTGFYIQGDLDEKAA